MDGFSATTRREQNHVSKRTYCAGILSPDLLQQIEDDGWRFHLRELALLSPLLLASTDALDAPVLFPSRLKEGRTWWQERFPSVQPRTSKREALRIAAAHMVVDVRQGFHALGTRRLKKRIVDDDGATPAGIRQRRLDGFVDDPRRKKQRELRQFVWQEFKKR